MRVHPRARTAAPARRASHTDPGVLVISDCTAWPARSRRRYTNGITAPLSADPLRRGSTHRAAAGGMWKPGLSYVGNSGPGHDRGVSTRGAPPYQAGPAGKCPPGHPDSTHDRSHARSLLPAPRSDPSVDRGRSGGTPGCPLPASRLATSNHRDQTVSSIPSRLRRRAAPRTPANPVPNSNRVPGSGEETRPVTSARGVAPDGT